MHLTTLRSAARALTTTAPAAGLAGVGLAGVGGGVGYGVIRAQARLARARAIAVTDLGPAGGDWGPVDGPPIRLAVLGDSTAYGLGCERLEETPGSAFAQVLAADGYRVRLQVQAVVGADTWALQKQVDAAIAEGVDVAYLSIGANDVTHRVATANSRANLRRALAAISDAGAAAVVFPCPDLGTVPLLPQPLRAYAGTLSRRLRAVQIQEAVACGARYADLSEMDAALAADPAGAFAADRYHGSPRSYAMATETATPLIRAAAAHVTADRDVIGALTAAAASPRRRIAALDLTSAAVPMRGLAEVPTGA
jgi:lysophospholipase L1-like esterase